MFKPIEWSEPTTSNTVLSAHSILPVNGTTPFGYYSILGEPAKNKFYINATPWTYSVLGTRESFRESFRSLELAKKACELEYNSKLNACLITDSCLDTKYKKVSTLADLSSLDNERVVAGYNYGLDNEREPKFSRAFWHGWRNAQIDKGRIPPDAESAALAKEVVASMNESLK